MEKEEIKMNQSQLKTKNQPKFHGKSHHNKEVSPSSKHRYYAYGVAESLKNW